MELILSTLIQVVSVELILSTLIKVVSVELILSTLIKVVSVLSAPFSRYGHSTTTLLNDNIILSARCVLLVDQ